MLASDLATTEHNIELEERKIVYDSTGNGPPIVFLHGVWATGGIWYPVIDRLAADFRCINVHLPLGVHRYASPRTVDHSPAALARVIAGLIATLDLHDVTLVGNDTGGALAQIVVTKHPARIERLVLTNCDAFEVFPPRKLAPLYFAARYPAIWKLFAKRLRNAKLQRLFFSTVAHAPPDAATLHMLMSRFADDDGVREDLRLTIDAIGPEITLEAAKHFAEFTNDVLLLWGTDDVFFPVSLARRLQRAFPHARLQLIPKAKLFVGIDQPAVVAAAIAEFVRPQRRPDSRSPSGKGMDGAVLIEDRRWISE